MVTARKGLRKYGLGGYFISGPKCVVQIQREKRPWWRIWRTDMPTSFHYGLVRGLTEARKSAEWLAGVTAEEPDDWPDPAHPKFMRRYVQPRKSP